MMWIPVQARKIKRKSKMTTRENTLSYHEKKGSSGRKYQYIYNDSKKDFIELIPNNTSSRHGILENSEQWLKDVFLPQGYPESVSNDYLQYQFWDTAQAYCSSIAGALSLQATLTGLGVGESGATALAATLTWLLKDGAGMVAAIAFAYFRGSQLDCNCKQWRLFADVANDFGMLLRLLGPLLPVPFVLVMCLSSVMMALVGVAGGATRAALTLHQALRENMADVSAKDGSQETLVNLAALITSLTVLPLITVSLKLTWVTFLLCVFFHLLCNYRAVRSVEMSTLNRPRILLALHTWVTTNAVPTVKEGNRSEPLLTGPAFITGYFVGDYNVHLGCSLNESLKHIANNGRLVDQVFSTVSEAFNYDNYMVFYDINMKQIWILYKDEISPLQELEVFFMAYILVLNLNHIHGNSFIAESFIAPGVQNNASDNQLLTCVRSHAIKIFPDFLRALNDQGWNTNKHNLASDEWRVLDNNREDKED